jgi:hypothetical protein
MKLEKVVCEIIICRTHSPAALAQGQGYLSMSNAWCKSDTHWGNYFKHDLNLHFNKVIHRTHGATVQGQGSRSPLKTKYQFIFCFIEFWLWYKFVTAVTSLVLIMWMKTLNCICKQEANQLLVHFVQIYL